MERIKVTQDFYPTGLKLRHVGFLELEEYYRWLKRWVDFQGYGDEGGEFDEVYYKEEASPRGGRNIEMMWRVKKRHTNYIKFVIEIMFRMLGVRDAEAIIENKKIKVDMGDFEIQVSSYLEKTYKVTPLRRLYDFFIIRKQLLDFREELWQKTMLLFTESKQYFDRYRDVKMGGPSY